MKKQEGWRNRVTPRFFLPFTGSQNLALRTDYSSLR